MKVLQLNTVCGNGSVGKITVDLVQVLSEAGDDGLILYGRRKSPEGVPAKRIGNAFDMGTHVLRTFFTGGHGFGSRYVTGKVIEEIKAYGPDLIQLHNIHGFYLNVEMLFAYLKEAGIPVVWTLHDCWAFTGHCAYFDYAGCDKWKTGCHDCTQYRTSYPYALFHDGSKGNYARKKAAFTGIKNLTIVTPSAWLKEMVEQSFLKEYPVVVLPNGVDQTKFKPTKGRMRKKYHLEDKKVLLGVASVWEKRKGLEYFLDLAERLPEEYRIVLIGLDKKQLKNLPANILGFARTANAEELAMWYTTADVYVNPTLEDNFPTTNLESLSCGTPVVTFATGGSPESLEGADVGRVVPKGDKEALLKAVQETAQNRPARSVCLKQAQRYEKHHCFTAYLDLYKKILEGEEKMNTTTKVSIITTTYNNADNLRTIMNQVLGQTYPNIEYIVVDGASKDHTVEVLKEMEPKFGGRLKWISEPDKGIYDAINKGVKMATGDIIGTCFDHFVDEHVIAKMVYIMDKEGTDGVHADLVYKDGDKIIRTWKQGQGKIRFGWMPGHPTLYLKKAIYDKYGLYKTDYVCSADYEFMIRILHGTDVRLSYIPQTLIEMDYGGTSTSSLKAYWVSLVEGHRGLKENHVKAAWFTDGCRIARLILQFIRR